MTLPSGWQATTVADVAVAMFDGPFGSALKTSDYTDEGVRVARLENIGHLTFKEELRSFVSKAKAESLRRHLLRGGDILFSSFVDQETRVCQLPDLLDGKIINKADCFCVRTDRSICEPRFLAYKLAAPSSYETFSSNVRGITRPRIGLRDLGAFEIDLPPLPEQRRIVAKLDALFARLGRARVELDRALNLAVQIRISALRSVFHFDAEMPAGWSLRRVDEIGEVHLGRQRSPKDHIGPHMRPYLRAANVTWNGWDLSNVKEMNFSPDEFAAFSLRDGDVLLNEGSGSAKEVGKPAVWRCQIADVCFQNTLLRIRPRAYNSDLLRYCLLYLALSGQFVASTKGVNIIHIGKAGLARFRIPTPPESEHQGLVGRLDAAFARSNRLEAEAARARALLDRLEAAILAKAFKGELVPQDPNDEPASVLLERSNAARRQQAQSQPKRGRKASLPKTPREKAVMTKSRQDEDVRYKPYLANIIRQAGGSSNVEDLFKIADLPVTDFYKQLAWEVDQGHIRDQNNQTLQAA
ncbi:MULTISPECIES: restriction endonuclease subunit S [Bradyrhizobium]|uniref:restriction endonuclease subunit S n=1 Tax=Bradyrhizobium TaxID=374 RepID=UPI0004B53F14|nr:MULTISPECIES: restriction endonuclease subunit S [Bradyrhizobium]MDI2076694.1 restriction endonuclease subunit S [Bradyrhizobium sp. Mp27]